MKFLRIVGKLILVLFSIFFAIGFYITQQANYYQGVVGPGLERQLGFTHGSPFIFAGDETFELFTLHPRPGGALAAAGVRDSDIVLSHTITGFYRALHKHPGSTATFRVTDGDDGAPIEQRPVRTITLQVPARDQTQ